MISDKPMNTYVKISDKERRAKVKFNSSKLRSNSKMSETEIIFRSTRALIRFFPPWFNRRGDSTCREALIKKKKKSAIQLTEDGGFESSWNPEVGRHLQGSIGLQKN